jgi:hypothetical protein
MHFNISHILHFLTLALLALLVHANPIPGIRADDNEPAEALNGILDNSINFSAKAEAILMPRIEEWLVQKPFQSTFSTITNSTSVFKKLVEYVVESERGRHHNASFIYSSNDNVTTVEVEKGPVKDVKLTLLFRASEYGFRSSDFHRMCDRKGPTITIVKAENGPMAAAYSGVDWGLWGALNPRGFLASIAEDPGAMIVHLSTRILTWVHGLEIHCTSQIDAMKMKDLFLILKPCLGMVQRDLPILCLDHNVLKSGSMKCFRLSWML